CLGRHHRLERGPIDAILARTVRRSGHTRRRCSANLWNTRATKVVSQGGAALAGAPVLARAARVLINRFADHRRIISHGWTRMHTDSKTKHLSVCIRVHPWPKKQLLLHSRGPAEWNSPDRLAPARRVCDMKVELRPLCVLPSSP